MCMRIFQDNGWWVLTIGGDFATACQHPKSLLDYATRYAEEWLALERGE
jgi:hypothetical protein